MERYYRFAGVEIAVCIPQVYACTNEYNLAPFAVEAVSDPHSFSFQVVDALDAPDGPCLVREPGFRIYQTEGGQVRYIGTVDRSLDGAYIRAVHRGKEHHVQVRAGAGQSRVTSKTVLNSMDAVHLVARAGGFVFHCAYILRDGKAILFTAPSETGKSTQAELWKKLRGAQIINGDRAAVRIVDGRVVAEGIPFAGSSAYCLNHSAPIEAVVYLGQAPVTSIRPMRGYEAFARIWEGCSVNTWDREDVSRISDAVKHLAETVPVYHLPCTPDESAVIALENALKSR